ncbi:MAG: hypothetical protein ACLTJE_21285 [Enterocloster bolteae]|uniref:hypothetical protein n=1 Tax=Enterocloster bolteae TaxID=208479 RepID=UPI0039923D3B
MAVEYGTIAVVPMGTWEDSKDYNVGNLVELDGSSYVAKVKPPAGTSPTDTAYWQVSAKGASKATADIAGVVKPDGVTTEVDANASLSVKKATQATVGIVKGSNGIKVGAEGSIDVDTTFTQATDLANIIAGEAIASVLGKVSKAIATTMSLDQNALLKNMLTSIDGNSSEKVPTQAYIHTLVERIGMGIELTAGANLTEVANELSSNLDSIPLIKYGTVICRYRDAGYLQASIDVSDFKSYKIFLSFDSDTDGFINNEPYPFNVNNTVYIRSGKVNFVSGASMSIAYLIVGIKK